MKMFKPFRPWLMIFAILAILLMAFVPDVPFVGPEAPSIPPVLITAAALATFVLEVVKTILRRVILNDPGYDFPPIFYETGVPLVVFLSQVLFGYLGWSTMPEFTLTYLIQWLVGVVIALATYQMALKPLKSYRAIKTNLPRGTPPSA